MEKELLKLWQLGLNLRISMRRKDRCLSWLKTTTINSAEEISYVWYSFWTKKVRNQSWSFWRILWTKIWTNPLDSSTPKDWTNSKVNLWLKTDLAPNWSASGKASTHTAFTMASSKNRPYLNTWRQYLRKEDGSNTKANSFHPYLHQPHQNCDLYLINITKLVKIIVSQVF